MEKLVEKVATCQNMVEKTQKLAKGILAINLNMGAELKSLKKDLTTEYEGALVKKLSENTNVEIHEDGKNFENKPEDFKEYCKTCKKCHEPYAASEKINLCISDSTLHKFHEPLSRNVTYEGDATHCEYLTKPGAKVEELQRMFESNYAHEKRKIDVLLVAGLNNLIRSECGENLVEKYIHFKTAIKNQNEHNTCGIAPLLYAPQLCWYPGNGPPPYYHFKNRLNEIQQVNSNIIKLNKTDGLEGIPIVQEFGLSVDNRTGQVKHLWEQWREGQRARMLHLNDEHRTRLGRCVNRYFT